MFLSEEVKGLGTIICSLLYFYYIFFFSSFVTSRNKFLQYLSTPLQNFW